MKLLLMTTLVGLISGKGIDRSMLCDNIQTYIQEFRQKISEEKTLTAKGEGYAREQEPMSLNAFVESNGDMQRIFEYVGEKLNISNSPSNQMSAAYQEALGCPSFRELVRECRAIAIKPPTCQPKSPYRTSDGTCNNLNNPTWGSVFAEYRRLMPPHYKGLWGFRESVNGGPLPMPRNLSLRIHQGPERSSEDLSHMFMFFGQLIAHDTTDVPLPKLNGAVPPCCPDDFYPWCMPIRPVPNDPFYGPHNVSCVFMYQHPPLATCQFNKRQHFNSVPVFLDAHFVYGRTDAEAQELRTQNGYLKTQSKNLMPMNKSEDDQFCTEGAEYTKRCFKGGDSRVNQHTTLMALQTIFVREHNRMVDDLRALNPQWVAERLYQVARKILGAKMQVLVYKEYLPLLLGADAVERYGLKVGARSRYEPSLSPNATHEFATFGFRLHNSINRRIAPAGCARTLLRHTFKNPEPLHGGCVDGFLRAACTVPQKQYDRFLTEEVTDFMYLHFDKDNGLDLASYDIQRGRDHGLAPYAQFVEHWSGGALVMKEWADFEQVMSKKNVRLLMENYQEPADVDAWVGMLLERRVPSSAGLGPSSLHLSAEHFARQRAADRFYFEHQGLPNSFTKAQIESLYSVTLSRIICDNTGLDDIAENVFRLPGPGNPVVSCDDIPCVNLLPWKVRK